MRISDWSSDVCSSDLGHPGSRATSFVARGNRVGDADLPRAIPVEHWYQLADIEVAADRQARAIVTIGDSITDGHGATTDGADRWPDQPAARLRAAGADIGARKSGVEGKSVAVRVGLGGGRIIKKKKKKT